jgi:hypothetical protein
VVVKIDTCAWRYWVRIRTGLFRLSFLVVYHGHHRRTLEESRSLNRPWHLYLLINDNHVHFLTLTSATETASLTLP